MNKFNARKRKEFFKLQQVYYSMTRPHLMQQQAGVTGEQTEGVYER